MVAAYFAPIAWIRPTLDGGRIAVDPVWDAMRFAMLIDRAAGLSTCAMLTIGGAMRRPDHLIRHER